jgi:signal transduction histidine kinase
MARTDATVAPLRAALTRPATTRKWVRAFLTRSLLTRIALVLLAALAVTLVVSDTLFGLLAVREQHMAWSLDQADTKASLLAERLNRQIANSEKIHVPSDAQKLLSAAFPFNLQPKDVLVGVSDRSGHIVASLGFGRQINSLDDLVGRDHVAQSNRVGATRVTTPDGVDAVIALRNLAEPLGQVALVTPTSQFLSLWQEHMRLLAHVIAIATLALALSGIAFFWQRRRAHTAQNEGNDVRAKMRAVMTEIWRNEQELTDKEQKLENALTDLDESRVAIERQACELSTLTTRCLEQQRLADCAHRAKAEFLANMSHELRTPLNAIIGFSEIMESGLFGTLGSEKYGEYVSDIRRSGQYLLAVISDILEMSRIESGQSRIERRAVPLKDIIGEAAVSVASAAEAKNLALTVGAPSGENVEADPRALVKVLIHLARNAIHHTPEGGSIKIRAKRYASHVGIHVGDTGTGIPKDRLAHLGRPFQRVHADNMRPAPGSGLGLAIARSLVELHGGRLRIKSRQGSGTVVVLSLPRKKAA